jgi:hypothetical protein
MDVAASQLQLISFGREKTLVPPSTVEGEAVNRRAEFMVLTDGAGLSSSDTEYLRFKVGTEK